MDIEERLVDYFRNHAGGEVKPETRLVEEGVIDSMGVMELLAFIESTFGVTPDMDDLTIENFATINDIKNFILCKGGNSLT
jgi:acyl carrier protein